MGARQTGRRRRTVRRSTLGRRIWRSFTIAVSGGVLCFAMLAGWFDLGAPDRLASTLTVLDDPDATSSPTSEPLSRSRNRGPVSPTTTPEASPSPTTTSPSPSPTPSPTPLVVVAHGSGTFRTAPGAFGPYGSGEHLRYHVKVERDLPFAPVEVAQMVDRTLSDPRSWAAHGWARFERVGSDEEADFDILLATPDTTDELCAPLETQGEVSCRMGDRVVINARRWGFAVKDFHGDITGYRRYVINHEVGHRLGNGHVDCTGAGDPAPVMMQQTKGVEECKPNSWPLPFELERSS